MLARFGAMVVRPLTSMLLGFFHSVSVAGLNSVGSKEEASLALYEGSRLLRNIMKTSCFLSAPNPLAS